MIRKCLFPAAGYGTRFLPATKAMPKEMLPIVNKPLIQYGVEEAHAAGLQWVLSDAEKVRQAQEAIANTPKPVHVRREPKPAVVMDTGPLVLVETRQDLRTVNLPF